MVVLLLVFKEISILAVSIYIPINNARRYSFLYTLSSICSTMGILTSTKRYLTVVLICISLIMSDTEHLFMCLLAICTSSLEKCSFRFSAHFLTGLFVFLVLSCMSYFCILEINCQLFHLPLFPPILRAVFSPCL